MRNERVKYISITIDITSAVPISMSGCHWAPRCTEEEKGRGEAAPALYPRLASSFPDKGVRTSNSPLPANIRLEGSSWPELEDFKLGGPLVRPPRGRYTLEFRGQTWDNTRESHLGSRPPFLPLFRPNFRTLVCRRQWLQNLSSLISDMECLRVSSPRPCNA